MSVPLDPDNVTWLRGRAGASGGSVSELLNRIVSAAPQGGRRVPGADAPTCWELRTNG